MYGLIQVIDLDAQLCATAALLQSSTDSNRNQTFNARIAKNENDIHCDRHHQRLCEDTILDYNGVNHWRRVMRLPLIIA